MREYYIRRPGQPDERVARFDWDVILPADCRALARGEKAWVLEYVQGQECTAYGPEGQEVRSGE